MGQYATNEELAADIRIMQTTGEITERLMLSFDRIFTGVARASLYGMKWSHEYYEDCRQTFLLNVWEHRQRIDGNLNPFAYLTSIAFNTIRQCRRKHRYHCNMLDRLSDAIRADMRAELRKAGRHVGHYSKDI